VDEHTSNDEWSSVRRPSDFVDEKPGTDVLLLGTARPPAVTTTTEMDVVLTVAASTAPLHKRVRVRGPSVYYDGPLGIRPGPAAPLGPTPLLYELAYGGHDEHRSGLPLVDWRNPAGIGVAVERTTLLGRRAPQLEDPDAPLGSLRPSPTGFGPIAPSWQPRRRLAGTYDAEWRRLRAPLRPTDFDPRHNCSAPHDLWCERPLEGGEPVEVVGVTAAGVWRFRVPQRAPRIRARVDGRERELPTHLDTLLIDADAQRVELSYRARVPLPIKWDRLESIRVDETPARSTPQPG
jgi:hypothetical protein